MNVNSVNYRVAGKSTFKGAPVNAEKFAAQQAQAKLATLESAVSAADGTAVNIVISNIKNSLAKISKGSNEPGNVNNKIKMLNIEDNMRILGEILGNATNGGKTAVQSALAAFNDAVNVLKQICFK